MNKNTHAVADQDPLNDTIVGKLTRAAYEVALRHGAANTWLEGKRPVVGRCQAGRATSEN
jgi:hypothetical protein